MEQIRQTIVYGVRQQRTFQQAASKYLVENQHLASINDNGDHLRLLDQFIGHLTIENVHIGTLQPFIAARKEYGVKTKTINNALAVVRRILNLAASEWIDETGKTWLQSAPKIRLLPLGDSRQPYPVSREEQARLFKELPDHLAQMCLFKVNTGCRQQEVCGLQWKWEVSLGGGVSVFVVPAKLVKNRQERIIVLNNVAKSVVDSLRDIHDEYVFTYDGNRILRINNSAWIKAKTRAELKHVRVHDLKHTFGQRLRAAGVTFEDRQDLLGHRSGRITTHYSKAELSNLIIAANKVVEMDVEAPNLTLIGVGS